MYHNDIRREGIKQKGVFFRLRFCGARGPREGEAGPSLSTSRLCHLIFRPKSQLEVRRQSSTRCSPLRKNRGDYKHRGTTQKRFAPCHPLLLIQLYALPLAGFRCVKYRAIRWHVPLHVEQAGPLPLFGFASASGQGTVGLHRHGTQSRVDSGNTAWAPAPGQVQQCPPKT